MDETNERTGLCWCGCGRHTSISKHTSTKRGTRKGEPVRFISGHNMSIRVITEDDFTVEDRGYETPCWIWNGAVGQGRGRVTVRGRNTVAHRAMYEQEVGPIPAGKELDHLCNVPLCVRPQHLEPVTHFENIRRSQVHRRKSPKLSPEQVAKIRELYAAGGVSQRTLGEQFGVSESLVGRHVWDVTPAPV